MTNTINWNCGCHKLLYNIEKVTIVMWDQLCIDFFAKSQRKLVKNFPNITVEVIDQSEINSWIDNFGNYKKVVHRAI